MRTPPVIAMLTPVPMDRYRGQGVALDNPLANADERIRCVLAPRAECSAYATSHAATKHPVGVETQVAR